MNSEKLILEIIEENNIIIIKKYKSLLELSRDYPDIPYHNLRGIYLNKMKEDISGVKGKLRIVNNILNNRYKIYDNPDYLNRFKQNEKDLLPVIVA